MPGRTAYHGLLEIGKQDVAVGEATQKTSIENIEKRAEEALLAVASPQATEVMPLPVVSASTPQMDPEIIELFIEEAKEEIASIKRHLPAWAAAPDDMEKLITVRRSFHTLKGSGRMVGAERIGEYCWAVENLLNRLINRTLTRTPPMIDFIQLAASAVPELVEQLEVGTAPKADVNLFIARSNAPALKEIAERFREAIDRNFWHPRSNTAIELLNNLAGERTPWQSP